ncbi:hypothetical protein [Streptomyces triticisoli]|uniref:hypothetical protein n=1 Tax=Streptomyces triticisoli TaxID=2182797 RepID=UPI000DD8EC25|nr:hypothetical protein [Streptomyces triticisoli]
MTVTWRSAVSYAFTVVVLSWLTGAAVDVAWTAASDGPGGWLSPWVKDPWNAVFVAAAVASLTLARRFLSALPRWRVVLVDGFVYLVVLLVCSGVSAWADGDDVPADAAFMMAIFALFTLQLPAAWLLCAWRTGHLEVVLSRGGASGKYRDQAGR